MKVGTTARQHSMATHVESRGEEDNAISGSAERLGRYLAIDKSRLLDARWGHLGGSGGSGGSSLPGGYHPLRDFLRGSLSMPLRKGVFNALLSLLLPASFRPSCTKHPAPCNHATMAGSKKHDHVTGPLDFLIRRVAAVSSPTSCALFSCHRLLRKAPSHDNLSALSAHGTLHRQRGTLTSGVVGSGACGPRPG